MAVSWQSRRHLPLDWTWSTGMALLAETCAILGDEERAEVLYERILPFARRLVVVGIGQFCLGSFWRSLAILAAAMRRWDDAARHFEEALEVNGQIGARTFVVRTQRAYAAMLLDRNRTGDAERAGELVQQGLRTTRGLKMRLERERLHELAGYASCSNFRESTRLAQGGRQHF